MFADPSGHFAMPNWLKGLAIGLGLIGGMLVIGAVCILTCGVGALAGTMAGAIIYGAAQGIVVGAAVGAVGGTLIGGAVTDWSVEGMLIGAGIGFGGGAIIGGIIGGFSGASKFAANSVYITENGGNVKEVLSAFKGNPQLKSVKSNATVYRYWGGSSGELGHWVSPIEILFPSAPFTPPSVDASVPVGKVNVAVKSNAFFVSNVPPFALIFLVTFKEPSSV